MLRLVCIFSGDQGLGRMDDRIVVPLADSVYENNSLNNDYDPKR